MELFILSNRYLGLSLTELNERLINAEQSIKPDIEVFEGTASLVAVIGLMSLLVLFMIALFGNKWSILWGIIPIGLICFFIYNTNMQFAETLTSQVAEIEEAKTDLLQNYNRLSDNKTADLVIEDISILETIPSEYCLNIKETEDCYFVRFDSSQEKVAQTIVPMDKMTTVDTMKKNVLSYYNISNDQKIVVSQLFETSKPRIGSLIISPEHLVLGKSLVNE